MKIAVVGAGISGLSAAWLLSKRHDVTLFERENRLGGHSNTVDVATADGVIPVDTGFIVYNVASYPNLVRLFDHLRVPNTEAPMTFAVSMRDGAYEYSGTGISGLFGQPGNMFRPDHWRMSADIVRFFREAEELQRLPSDNLKSLGQWFHERNYSRAFIDNHILPMAAAIWSTPADQMLSYPAAAFARFFSNHGLLKLVGRPIWRTVVGGSRAYVVRLLAAYAGRVRSHAPVTRIDRQNNKVLVNTADSETETFDHCVLACHADEALALLGDRDAFEHEHLAPFQYTTNIAVLHRDRALMPKRKRLWSSWNYIGAMPQAGMCVSYWMNCLQSLKTRDDLFVTLNPIRPIQEKERIAQFSYDHPLFDTHAMMAQRRLWNLQGRRNTWFAGSYFGYGFHEDGLQSGLAVAEQLGDVSRPWCIENPSSRIPVVPRASRPAKVLEPTLTCVEPAA